MATTHISIRINPAIVEFIDKIANKHEWSRNKTIVKFLTEKVYELSGDSG